MKVFRMFVLNKGAVNISAFLEFAAVLYQRKDSSVTALLRNSKVLESIESIHPFFSFIFLCLLPSKIG